MTDVKYPELPKPVGYIYGGVLYPEDKDGAPVFSATQMHHHADATCALRGAQSDMHLAWRGALKACGIRDADVDAISDVVLSMLAEPLPSPPTPEGEAK